MQAASSSVEPVRNALLWGRSRNSVAAVTDEPRGWTVRPFVALFLVGTTLTAAWVSFLWYGADQQAPVTTGAFVTDYDGRELHDGLEILLVQSDGQAFATLARDPLLRRPESFIGPGEAAYRAQRPLLPYLAWAGSVGQSGWVPPALAVVAVLGTGLAVTGAGALVANRGRSPWFGLVVLVLPGVPAALEHFGPEPLVLGLLLWALALWERDRQEAAAALFVLAALGRETALLVPLVLGVQAMRQGRWRAAGLLLLAPGALAAWWVVLRLRVGSWPTEGGDGRLGMPLTGLFDAAETRWEQSTQTELLFLMLGVLIVVAAVVVARRSILTPIVVLHALFATTMGDRVWGRLEFYGRVLLPMYAIGVIAVIREWGRGAEQEPPTTSPVDEPLLATQPFPDRAASDQPLSQQ